MIKKKTSSLGTNKFGVESRDLTAAQRCELFTEYKNSLPDPKGDFYSDRACAKQAKPRDEEDDFSKWGGDSPDMD